MLWLTVWFGRKNIMGLIVLGRGITFGGRRGKEMEGWPWMVIGIAYGRYQHRLELNISFGEFVGNVSRQECDSVGIMFHVIQISHLVITNMKMIGMFSSGVWKQFPLGGQRVCLMSYLPVSNLFRMLN